MTIEVSAKKVDDAIKQGLAQLGASLDEVNVEVLEQGGLFRKARVRLTLEREEEQPAPKKEASTPEKKQTAEQPAEKPEKTEKAEKTDKKPIEKKPVEKKSEQTAEKPEKKVEKKPTENKKSDKPEKTEAVKENAERPARNSEEAKQAIARATEFITELVKKMGFTDATVESNEKGDVAITAPAGDDSLIIGRHGETLSAISFLAETLGRAEKQHVSIVADCNGYRERRAASLTAMAKRRAGEAVAKHRKIKLEPMERVDRRTIHNALSNDERVTTASEGKEPYRYIVILPKREN